MHRVSSAQNKTLADLRPAGETVLQLAGVSCAGDPCDGLLAPGQCVRIMTGAMMPADCDTVVPLELTSPLGADRVSVPPGE